MFVSPSLQSRITSPAESEMRLAQVATVDRSVGSRADRETMRLKFMREVAGHTGPFGVSDLLDEAMVTRERIDVGAAHQ